MNNRRLPVSRLFSPTLRLSLFLGLVLLLAGAASVGQASSSIVVNTFEDVKKGNDGLCSLREAVIAANSDKQSGGKPGECVAGNGADTIFLPAGTYFLSRSDSGQEDAAQTGDLDIDGDLTIVGGPGLTTVDANGITDRVFHVLKGNVKISDVTIKNGHISGDGGGIHNNGSLTLERVTLTGNSASAAGGAIFNMPSRSLTVTNSTLSGNSASGAGGAILNRGSLTLDSATVADNSGSQGGGLRNDGGTISIRNTIVAGNTAPSAADCSGTLSSAGYNLIQNTAGCTIGGDTTGNLTGLDPRLGTLQNNGGNSLTRALLLDSPALEAGPPNCPPPDTDQRGVSRPRGVACDIGAFEVQDPPQPGPIFTINTTDDVNDGLCSFDHCSLPEGIEAANARTNGASPDQIHFNLPAGGPATIAVASPLPAVTDPVSVDGTTQPGGPVTLDGAGAGPGGNGLTISAGQTTVTGLVISGFDGHGILLTTAGGNLIQGNTLTGNGGDGVRVESGTGNTIRNNAIFDNGGLGIDLGGDGVTPNDTADPDGGANDLQNFPTLIRAFPDGGATTIDGWFNSAAETTFTLDFYAGPTCDPSGSGEGESFLGSLEVTTDLDGTATFRPSFETALAEGQFVTATATDPAGNTSEFSTCARVAPANDSWPRALRLVLGGPPENQVATIDQVLDRDGQSRWYKFSIQPNSKVIVTLTNLPANYDLTIYKDIAAAFTELNSPQDLVRLGAEFAPEAFSPEAFSPEAFSPEAFSPEAFSPEAFSPEAFSPEAFSPEAFSPEAFSPEAFSPEAFSPEAFSPEAFSPEAFSPEAFSPEAFSPEAFSPEAFSGAQLRSLLGISAFNGTVGEGLIVNTWSNVGDFYIRVAGRNGVSDRNAAFHVEVRQVGGTCGQVVPSSTPSSPSASAGGYRTIIITDLDRMAGSGADKAALQSRLADFAARPEVAGVVVDMGGNQRVLDLNAQADANPACPYAKNLVAEAIKEVIDAYRGLNPLEYIVLVGGDETIPFFRHPDTALLANEKNFVPPVRDSTASQASLKLGYVLSQDAYASEVDFSLKGSAIPVPDLAIGRLVETAADAVTMLDAYLLGTNNGVVPAPSSALVTGYDFLEDAALAVQSELEAGLGAGADALISPQDLSPADPAAWTADDLRSLLLGSRHDLVFLAGHFSASGALAADYRTRMVAAELTASPVDLTNAVIFSAGCHAGYNIVDEHGVPGVTAEPDWAKAFAGKGATLLAGTGYQYGDTDFLEYSERLYLEFSRQLRTGSGPVSVGQALVAAKRVYLANTAQMRGIHEKALLEATLFGLPMLSIDMPGSRLPAGSDASIVGGTTPFGTNPGQMLGLAYADVSLNPVFGQHPVPLKLASDPNTTVTALYLSGSDGTVTNPAEPALALEVHNVAVPGTIVRGVGFRGGSYTDLLEVIPFTGAPTTEVRGVHAPFLSDVFYPVRPWGINYPGALANPAGDVINLVVTPNQFRSTEPGSQTSTLRQFNQLNFRLYYSNNIADFGPGGGGVPSIPALAAPPTIAKVSATPVDGTVLFRINVTGNPAAGIQEVWVTYTAVSGPLVGSWQSLNLTQSSQDSTLWEGALALNGTPAEDIRYIVQAVNGVGLVNMAANLGAYYIPGVEPVPSQPSELALELPATSGPYGSQATFSAVLTSNGTPLAGQRVTFSLGPQSRQAVTDGNGRATLTRSLLGLPDLYEVRASFAGTSEYAPSFATGQFTITRQNTALSLDPASASGLATADVLMTATLKDVGGQPLREKTVIFVVSGNGQSHNAAVITDYAGRATLGNVPLPPGSYTVQVYFSGTIPLGGGPTVTLDDDRYNPTSASGSLTLVNTAPEAADDAYSVDEDSTLNVAAPGVLENDSDADEQTLTAVLVGGPSNGTLTLNADGSFTYTPASNFSGTDSFTYQADDGLDRSNTATVTITVNPVDDAPVAVDDAYEVAEDDTLSVAAPGVLANDEDADGDSLTASLVSGPAHGALTLNPDGSFTYSPAGDFNGLDSFVYQAGDGALTSNQATVTITVNPVNDPPVANDDSGATVEDTPVTIDVLANDTDVDGDALVVDSVTQGANGSVTNNGLDVTYSPNPGFAGTDTFTYVASDGNGGTDTATVTVTVDAVNDPPDCSTVTPNPQFIWPPDKDFKPVSVTGVTDPDGDPVSITIVSIFQDEPVGKGKNSPDGRILGPNSAEIRAERDGNGDGRVYHVGFNAEDGRGGLCSAIVRVGIVPHDQGGDLDAIDGGPLYDSTIPEN